MKANNQYGWSILYLNYRSLPAHFGDIMHLLQSVVRKFKVIALPETWLITDKHRLSDFEIDGYSVYTESWK